MSRRVKKGPGRRPQSAKRRRFMELRARGGSVVAAAREVGVSRTAGNNWSRGHKTCRGGKAVGFVPALDANYAAMQRLRPDINRSRLIAGQHPRRERRHPRRLATNEQLGPIVAELLAQRWSPAQISRHLRVRFPSDPGMWLCHESIYQALYQPGSELMRPFSAGPAPPVPAAYRT